METACKLVKYSIRGCPFTLTRHRLEWYFCLRFTELHLENHIQKGFCKGRLKAPKTLSGIEMPIINRLRQDLGLKAPKTLSGIEILTF